MRRYAGQATTEWLIIALMTTSILWLASSHWDLMQQLSEWGVKVIEHYHFIFNYLSVAPGSGM